MRQASTPHPLRRMLGTAAAAAVLAALGGCAGATSSVAVATETTPANVAIVEVPSLPAGAPVPAPKDTPVLTLTGRIGSTNEGEALKLDADTLDRLGRIQVSVFDPWTKQDVQIQGTWLADVLTVAQADGAAQQVHLAALDDYEIDLAMADVRAGGILLATRRGDGSAIPINEGGPTRIVFVGDAAAGSRPEMWIWSLKSIDVR